MHLMVMHQSHPELGAVEHSLFQENLAERTS